MKILEIQNRARALLEETLRSIPAVCDVRVKADLYLSDTQIDLLVETSMKGALEEHSAARHTLVVEVKTNGQPRWVRAACDQLDRHLHQVAANGYRQVYGVFIAPYVSEAAAEILRECGHGYLDLAGNGRLAFDGVYVERKGQPNPFSERSELRTLFSPKASRVLRTLLMHPYRPWRMAALAEEADVSLGLVAKVKPLLLDRAWVDETAQGLVLLKPAAALDAWGQAFRRRKGDVHDFYSFGNTKEAEERIAEAAEAIGARYVLAEFSGAERMAPHVRYSRASAYVEAGALEEAAHRADLRVVETGATVRLFEPYDEGVFFGAKQIGGIQVAHPVQLFLDLQIARGRGEEAAAFLRRQVIEPEWRKRQDAVEDA